MNEREFDAGRISNDTPQFSARPRGLEKNALQAFCNGRILAHRKVFLIPDKSGGNDADVFKVIEFARDVAG